MRAPIAVLAFAGTLTAVTASAQLFPSRGGPNAPAPAPAPKAMRAPGDATAPRDPQVDRTTILSPTPPDQLKPATIPLPDGPIEPYLLTAKNGPFMVVARSFRGPEAERFALALVLELRRDYGLPAYILRTKDFPRLSNIRNVPPTAEAGMDRAHLTNPEKVRTYDEAAVLVGDETTLKGSEVLLHKVKHIKPKCLEGMPKFFAWREGLKTATRTTNPFIPAQKLYPGRRDDFVVKLNDGPRSIYHCPGHYTLQVAEFSGRATFDVEGARGLDNAGLRKSPLRTAHEDAERLAAALAKIEEIRRYGYQTYVYHDRTKSRVMIGSFNSPNDPQALQLREYLVSQSFPIMDNATGKKRGIDRAIVPATYLTDVDQLKAK